VASMSNICRLRIGPRSRRVMSAGSQRTWITLNVEEADDAKARRSARPAANRTATLPRPLRHEVGHYYWDRLVWDTAWLERFRTLFGDERADYAAAHEGQLM